MFDKKNNKQNNKQNPFNPIPIPTTTSRNEYIPSMPFVEGGGANTTAGILYNTVAGLPKAAVGVAKNLFQGSARAVGDIGISAGNQVIRNYNEIRKNPIYHNYKQPKPKPIPLPFNQKIDTKTNPISNAIFGGVPIKTIPELKKETSKIIEPYVGKDFAKVSSLPLVGLGMYFDLAPFGGGAEIKTLGEIPEAFFKSMARDNNPVSIESKLINIGMDNSTAASLAGKFSQTKTVEEAKDVLGSHVFNEALRLKGNVSPVDNNKNIEVPITPKEVQTNNSLFQDKEIPTTNNSLFQDKEIPTTNDSLFSSSNNLKLPEYKIAGDTIKEKVRSAIANSESVRNDLRTKGQAAIREAMDYGIYNKKLDKHDLDLVYDYEEGIPISELTKKANNPTRFTNFINKLVNYYNSRYLNDIASGGETNYVKNYIPHIWDLKKEKDLKKFKNNVVQKGLKPWNGFNAQPRIFKTYKEGIEAGFKPANNNILEDLKNDYNRASSSISKQVLRNGLKEAAPKQVSLSGYGVTEKGEPFVNSNIKNMQGLSYSPEIDNLLKGFESLSNKDIFKIASRESGGGFKNTLKLLPKTAKEAGLGNVLGSIYDNVNLPLKHTILNLSGFHSINITTSYLGASLFKDPIKGIKGAVISIPAFFSEDFTNKVIDSFKNKMIPGKDMSVFDAGLKAGVSMDRGLPMKGHNPLHTLSNAIFNRELYTLKLNLVDQFYGNGKLDPLSVRGRSIGKQINEIMGEMNSRIENVNPNTQKILSRILLAPGFTESKYSTIFRAFTKNKKSAGNFARAAVLGKSIIVGTLATLGTLLATGNFPDLHQELLNYTINPSSQTNIRNRRGKKKEITFPKTYIDEPLSLFQNPGRYFRNRFAPALTDIYESLPESSIGTGKNYYGAPIIDPKSRKSPFIQEVTNIAKSNMPIGIQHLMNYKEGRETSREAALGIFGLNSRINKTRRFKNRSNPFNPI